MTPQWMTPFALAEGYKNDRKTVRAIRQYLYEKKRAALRRKRKTQL